MLCDLRLTSAPLWAQAHHLYRERIDLRVSKIPCGSFSWVSLFLGSPHAACLELTGPACFRILSCGHLGGSSQGGRGHCPLRAALLAFIISPPSNVEAGARHTSPPGGNFWAHNSVFCFVFLSYLLFHFFRVLVAACRIFAASRGNFPCGPCRTRASGMWHGV